MTTKVQKPLGMGQGSRTANGNQYVTVNNYLSSPEEDYFKNVIPCALLFLFLSRIFGGFVWQWAWKETPDTNEPALSDEEPAGESNENDQDESPGTSTFFEMIRCIMSLLGLLTQSGIFGRLYQA